MGNIRRFRVDDIPAIVALFGKAFGDTQRFAETALALYFQKLFFDNPWFDLDLPSFVYTDELGISGFIGVVPRRMRLRKRPVKLAVSNHFMVDPARRSGLVALELMRAFFNGPQDLSVAEGGLASRKIWEALGGQTSLLYSICWTRPLRPCRYVLNQLSRRGLGAPLVWAARPVCAVFDKLAPHIPGSPLRQPPRHPDSRATTDEFLAGVNEISRSYSLQPHYDSASLHWLLEVLEMKKTHGSLQKALVHSADGALLGSYVYYLNRGGVSEVLQLAAKPNCMPAVLDHLLDHASRNDAVSLAGRLDPKFMDDFSDRHCLMYRGDHPYLLVYTRDREIQEAFCRGEAFLSRMEAEWWISYPGG